MQKHTSSTATSPSTAQLHASHGVVDAVKPPGTPSIFPPGKKNMNLEVHDPGRDKDALDKIIQVVGRGWDARKRRWLAE